MTQFFLIAANEVQSKFIVNSHKLYYITGAQKWFWGLALVEAGALNLSLK